MYILLSRGVDQTKTISVRIKRHLYPYKSSYLLHYIVVIKDNEASFCENTVALLVNKTTNNLEIERIYNISKQKTHFFYSVLEN